MQPDLRHWRVRAEACAGSPTALMRQLGGCRLVRSLRGGHSMLQAVAGYCSSRNPGWEQRVVEFAEAMEEDSKGMMKVMEDALGGAEIPDALPPVSPMT